jgi:hypothetical protein
MLVKGIGGYCYGRSPLKWWACGPLERCHKGHKIKHKRVNSWFVMSGCGRLLVGPSPEGRTMRSLHVLLLMYLYR